MTCVSGCHSSRSGSVIGSAACWLSSHKYCGRSVGMRKRKEEGEMEWCRYLCRERVSLDSLGVWSLWTRLSFELTVIYRWEASCQSQHLFLFISWIKSGKCMKQYAFADKWQLKPDICWKARFVINSGVKISDRAAAWSAIVNRSGSR